MCGIVGYTGTEPAVDILIEGLQRLEYRGYDSAGVAVQVEDGLSIVRRTGKVGELARACEGLAPASTCGIGHTRWATHGTPSERNAHPQCSCLGDIALVHNGIIENYLEIKETLLRKGIHLHNIHNVHRPLTELIMGLPGETYDSFCEGICKLIEAGQHNAMTVYKKITKCRVGSVFAESFCF